MRTSCYFSKIVHATDIKEHSSHQRHPILTSETTKLLFDIEYENDNITIVIAMKYQESSTFTKKPVKTISKTTRHQQPLCNFVYNEFAMKSFLKTKFLITWPQKKECSSLPPRVSLLQTLHLAFLLLLLLLLLRNLTQDSSRIRRVRSKRLFVPVFPRKRSSLYDRTLS